MKRTRRTTPRVQPALAALAFAALGAVAGPAAAQAIEFRSAGGSTLVREQPSPEGRALFRLRPGTPVEVVVRQGGWVRVRDPEGGLAWVESSALNNRRTVIVSAERAIVRRQPQDAAPPSFEATRQVVLELVEPAETGWARVRHAEGFEGYVRASEVWGL